MSFFERFSILKEFWLFARYRKRYWLLPIMVFLFFLALFIIFTETSSLAPFIYTLF